MRLIDADELKKRVVKVMFRDTPESGEFYAVGTGDIDIMPTIDPESLRGQQHIGLVSTTVTRTKTRYMMSGTALLVITVLTMEQMTRKCYRSFVPTVAQK